MSKYTRKGMQIRLLCRPVSLLPSFLLEVLKWALIQNLGMSEADAHRYIEKQAMDRCVPRREIANSILATYP